MLRKCIWIFGVFLLLSQQAAAQSFLWQIKGSQNTVYLLGSIHVFKASDYPLAPPIETAYKRAQTIVFEVAPSEMAGGSLSMMQQALMTDGKRLQDVLEPRTFKKLKTFLGNEAALQGMQGFKPWFVSVSLVMQQVMMAGYDPSAGIDQHFAVRAASDSKQTAGLESMQDQLNLFLTLSAKEQNQFLEQTLTELGSMQSEFDKLVAAWKKGDTRAVEKFMLESFEQYPSIKNRFLVDRNRRWIPKIEKYLNEKHDVMVVVGAAHLVGNDSVISMLKQKGVVANQQ